MVGWSGLRRVEYWLRPDAGTHGQLAEDDPAWQVARWQPCLLDRHLELCAAAGAVDEGPQLAPVAFVALALRCHRVRAEDLEPLEIVDHARPGKAEHLYPLLRQLACLADAVCDRRRRAVGEAEHPEQRAVECVRCDDRRHCTADKGRQIDGMRDLAENPAALLRILEPVPRR